MKLRYLIGSILIVTAVVAGAYHPYLHRLRDLPDDMDPALIAESIEKNADSYAYAGINVWGQYGMRAERMIELLEHAGYHCNVPPALATPRESVEMLDLNCTKDETSPLHRLLTVHATIEHGMINRLMRADANSTLIPANQPAITFVADLLRKGGWLEPQTIAQAGLRFNSSDQIARMVVDNISLDGWYHNCKAAMIPARCGPLLRGRASDGFPSLRAANAATPTDTVWVIQREMELIGFTMVNRRGADNYADDALLVRLDDGKMWIDFVGGDMAGHRLKAALELDSAGGTPKSLMLEMDGTQKSVALAGASVVANNRAMTYLLPQAGDQPIRYAEWVNLPDSNYPGTFNQLIRVLPQVDPAYLEPMVKTMVDNLNTVVSPEETLGLYPSLWLIETKAAVLRKLKPDMWMPREQGNRIIAHTWPDDLITRAAWAFATCEGNSVPVSIDHNCVLRFITADIDAAALVRRAIAEQQVQLAVLPAAHPIRIRLDMLANAYKIESDESVNAEP